MRMRRILRDKGYHRDHRARRWLRTTTRAVDRSEVLRALCSRQDAAAKAEAEQLLEVIEQLD
jgi:hypothetical protein